MLKRTKLFARLIMVRIAIWLLKATGFFHSYYAGWRWAVFERAQAAGLHILPVHFYTPIPDTNALELDENAAPFYRADDACVEQAFELLGDFADKYVTEFTELRERTGDGKSKFVFGKAPYNTVEAEALYGLIRTRKPRRIVEIGCGKTTFLISQAISEEADYTPEYTCIEPYRPAYLRSLPPEVNDFRDQMLQEIDLSFFEQLEAGDILFIDSSHVVARESDTIYELLSLLPCLKSGVLIHIHDIFLPYDYPVQWTKESYYFWAEQYMLDALLQGNSRYKVILPLHQLYREHFDRTAALFPLVSDVGQRPGAYWLEVQ